MKTIEQYTMDELAAKIKAIKAEREKTANALKRYEEELERRKQEVPLGVPTDDNFCVNFNNTICDFSCKHRLEEMDYNIFNTFESAKKHAKMLLAWREALVANAKGEPIDIQVLLPLLPKGWVAMDEKGWWSWFCDKPILTENGWVYMSSVYGEIYPFSNLKPADDWKNSLMECGL